MRDRISIASLLALSFIASPTGCRTPVSTIAVIPRTTANLLWEPLHIGVAETAQGSGVHIHWNAPANEADSEKQLNLFAASIAASDHGIIFAPDETLAARGVVLQAVARHIPVVIVDDELGPPAGPYLSYVSNDEIAGATLAAQRLATILHGHGSVALMGISPRIEGALSREEDFEQALTTIAPGIHIKVRRFGDVVITHQQQIAQEILHGPEPIDAIVALTAPATRGAYCARISTDPHNPVLIVGFDQDILAPIQLGDVDSVIVQDTRSIGQLALKNLTAQIAGNQVPARTLVAPLLLTRQNLNSNPFHALFSFAGYQWRDQ